MTQPIAPAQVWDNKQASQMLAVSENTIRSWLARKSELQLGLHYTKEGTKTLWTQAGIEALEAIKRGDRPTDRPAEPLDIDSALQPHAERIAWQVIEARLPQAVAIALQRILNSSEGQERLDNLCYSLGLAVAGQTLSGSLNGAIADSKQLMGIQQ